jgi:hypothetical protein
VTGFANLLCRGDLIFWSIACTEANVSDCFEPPRLVSLRESLYIPGDPPLWGRLGQSLSKTRNYPQPALKADALLINDNVQCILAQACSFHRSKVGRELMQQVREVMVDSFTPLNCVLELSTADFEMHFCFCSIEFYRDAHSSRRTHPS